MSSQDEKRFELTFECDGTTSGKMRNDLTVRFVEEKTEFEFATDEGVFHGGEASAPPPLAMFAASFAACLMVQIRAFAKRMRVPLDGVKARLVCQWEARQTGREPYVSAPVGFSFDLELDSDAPLEDQLRVIEAAKKGCFIEATLAQPNDIPHRLKTADGWVDC